VGMLTPEVTGSTRIPPSPLGPETVPTSRRRNSQCP
jgi:hypothetical protein